MYLVISDFMSIICVIICSKQLNLTWEWNVRCKIDNISFQSTKRFFSVCSELVPSFMFFFSTDQNTVPPFPLLPVRTSTDSCWIATWDWKSIFEWNKGIHSLRMYSTYFYLSLPLKCPTFLITSLYLRLLPRSSFWVHLWAVCIFFHIKAVDRQ